MEPDRAIAEVIDMEGVPSDRWANQDANLCEHMQSWLCLDHSGDGIKEIAYLAARSIPLLGCTYTIQVIIVKFNSMNL